MEDLNSKLQDNISINQPFYKKIPTYCYNFIFELPFDNYKIYYKTGIIHKMSIDDKKKLSRNVHREELHRNFFIRMIRLRPQILDEEDQYHLNEVNHSVKIKRTILIAGLGLNWSYFCFNWIVLKKKKYKIFLYLNVVLFLGLVWTGRILTNENKILYKKYENVINKDEIFEMMKKVYNIN